MTSLREALQSGCNAAQLMDSIIMSAAVYEPEPAEVDWEAMKAQYGFAGIECHYRVISTKIEPSFERCKQTMLITRCKHPEGSLGPESPASAYVVVACRGTYSLEDTVQDLKFLPRTMSIGEGSAHSGFLNRARSIPLGYFRKMLHKGIQVVFTGHSLGGAVASLLAFRLLESTSKFCHQQVKCFTFGCPFFADNQLAVHINQNHRNKFVHLVSRHDLVPHAMPVAFTLYHVWWGLRSGPVADTLRLTRVGVELLQWLTRLPLASHVSRSLSIVPGLARVLLPRALAMVLAHRGGYSLAGQMIILDPCARPPWQSTSATPSLRPMDEAPESAYPWDLLCNLRAHSMGSYSSHVALVSRESTDSLASLVSEPQQPTGDRRMDEAQSSSKDHVFQRLTDDDDEDISNNYQEGRISTASTSSSPTDNVVATSSGWARARKATTSKLRASVDGVVFAHRLMEMIEVDKSQPSSGDSTRKRYGPLKLASMGLQHLTLLSSKLERVCIGSSLLFVVFHTLHMFNY